MPKLSPLDDIDTYRSVAEKSYNNRAQNAALKPKAVLMQRENDAESGATAAAAETPTSQAGFTKPFTPADRASQAEKLKAKLKQTGDF